MLMGSYAFSPTFVPTYLVARQRLNKYNSEEDPWHIPPPRGLMKEIAKATLILVALDLICLGYRI